jgi:hypothetical protein
MLADFAPSPAVESVHRHDPYVARDGYRCPYVLAEDYAAHDLMLLDRRAEPRGTARGVRLLH